MVLECDNKAMLALAHIEKAAGTTLIHILRRNYLLRYCDVRPLTRLSDGVFRPEDMRKTFAMNPWVRVIAGHSVFPHGELVAAFPNMRFITLMRNPVKRYISQYRHILERKGRPISFDSFLATEGFANFQTKKIAGNSDVTKAKEILSNRFLLAGIVEEFDQFLILLRGALTDIKFDPWYEPKNVASRQEKSAEIEVQYGDLIMEKNEADLELYQYIKDTVMPLQIDRYGDGFERDVEVFKDRDKWRLTNVINQYLDYSFRKCYVEPVSGIIRRRNGMPATGSYGSFPHPDAQPWL